MEFRNTSLSQNQGMSLQRRVFTGISISQYLSLLAIRLGCYSQLFDDNNDENGEILIENDLPSCPLLVYLCYSCSDLSIARQNFEEFVSLLLSRKEQLGSRLVHERS